MKALTVANLIESFMETFTCSKSEKWFLEAEERRAKREGEQEEKKTKQGRARPEIRAIFALHLKSFASNTMG